MKVIPHAAKRIGSVLEIPNLIELQLDSFQWFLEEGLPELFRTFSPIWDFTNRNCIEFVDFTLGEPKYSLDECRDRDMTFEAPIRATVRLARSDGEIIESEVYLGDLPLMTDQGSFIINGRERVIVSQLSRSPGIYFSDDIDLSMAILVSARVIPAEGPWLELEADPFWVVRAAIQQTKKLPFTQLLKAMSSFEQARAVIHMPLYRALHRRLAEPLADPETGEVLYDSKTLITEEMLASLPESLREFEAAVYSPCETTEDLLWLYGTRQTLQHPTRDDLTERGAQDDSTFTLSLNDLHDPETGDLIIRRMERIRPETAVKIESLGLPKFDVLRINRYIQATIEEDSTDTPVEALTEIYRRLRPGEQSFKEIDRMRSELLEKAEKTGISRFQLLSLKRFVEHMLGEVAPETTDSTLLDVFKRSRMYQQEEIGATRTQMEAMMKELIRYYRRIWTIRDLGRKELTNLFLDKRRYDLAKVGRFQLNRKLGIDVDLACRNITVEDLVGAIYQMTEVRTNRAGSDDIDHLQNKRVRSVGELLQSQLRLGFIRMEKVARERMTTQDPESILPGVILSVKPVSASIKSFFSSSQLSTFMDQTNPLSELTNKRRLSSLGPGGLSRQSAKLEVRDVHRSHYGRICPIETPEGPNIGLISQLTVYARVDEYGFIKTPYRIVKDGKVTDEVIYLSAGDDDPKYIAPSDVELDAEGRFRSERVQVRHMGTYPTVDREDVDLMDVTPVQMISVATASIPFLEHDDANRALMGANMQRQAVPLLRSEAPIVHTGYERRAAVDSGSAVIARRHGIVEGVTSKEIRVRASEDGEIDLYRLHHMMQSNKSTCFTHRPVVFPGQRVVKGQALADGPCCDHGEMALGKNVLVAYMPWGGYNYEDAILVSDRLVRDDVFTSIHIERHEAEAVDTKLGPEEITRDIPNVGEEALKDLDENGIIRIGAEVQPEDILVGKVAPKGQVEMTAEERLIIAIFGKEAEETRDVSLRCPHGERGQVVDVKVFSRFKYQCQACGHIYNESKKKDRLFCDRCDGELHQLPGDELPAGVNELVRVFVAQKRKLMEGDKMAGRHGNKGVISKILPQEDMPYLPNGRPVDIVLNPLGVPSRMNIGQILECHLGYVGHRLDCRFPEPAFECSTEDEILFEMKRLANALFFDALNGYLDSSFGIAADIAPEKTPEENLACVKQGLRNLGRYGLERVSAAVAGPPILTDEEFAAMPEELPAEEEPFAASEEVYDAIIERIRHNASARCGFDGETGKTYLRDGRTGDLFRSPVTVGYSYLMKLEHLADEKVHARSIGPYSLVTQQPLGGKAQFGGQRFGEMEVWALEAYGAAYTLQEILTVKSDDVTGRVKTYESIVKGESMGEPGVPESFKILVNELQSLCLRVTVTDRANKEIDLKALEDDGMDDARLARSVGFNL
ncbi:MAG: DNA-directed RNA polymerase subunit beta [Fimbriimonadia bacterium]|jgi:DNA-directed RNA polymerase subunit beta